MTKLIPTIRKKLKTMTKTQQAISRFITECPDKVVKMSISQLAEACGAKSEATIVRYYRQLGLSSYNDLKVSLAAELAENSYYRTYEDITGQDSLDTLKQKIFNGAIRTLDANLSLLDTSRLETALDLLHNAGRVFFLGFAISAALADMASFKFSKLLPNCRSMCDPHVTATVLAHPLPGDVVFAISHSGESKDLIIPVEKVKPIVKVIALTVSEDSPLAKIADVVITNVSDEMTYRTDAAMTRIVQMAIVETLYIGMCIRMGQPALDALQTAYKATSYLKY
ncbi:MurR/RpiR family transcriptional regulator [Desulfovibrio inopinatus]|uniref:MurR/RpiR family transcriptional regulator n=1 Tax=Desulfovibrio inopinatus TaxID=102109 RepID=UPI000419746C|nr:MurR/RpiR family transcriptional regulator [Desulfovibrio inopinatus]